MKEHSVPPNFLAATRYFNDIDVCVDFVASMRWPGGVECPHCDGKRVSYLKSRKIWKCMEKKCHKQFSVKTGSVFEDSPIALREWLAAVWLVVNCKNGISSYEIARNLGVTQKTAWFMNHRIRKALQARSWKMGSDGGAVEVDESYIGGKLINMHKSRRLKINQQKTELAMLKTVPRYPGKTAVMGMLDRESRQVRAKVVPNVKRETLQNEILNHIEHGAAIYTDEAVAYDKLKEKYIHETVNHLDSYVRGQVHTNGLENFWALLKRGLKGTYVCVEPFHLDRYVDEQVFRYNHRATKDNPLNDADRFMLAMSKIAGKRLTYAELTGKVGETTVS